MEVFLLCKCHNNSVKNDTLVSSEIEKSKQEAERFRENVDFVMEYTEMNLG